MEQLNEQQTLERAQKIFRAAIVEFRVEFDDTAMEHTAVNLATGERYWGTEDEVIAQFAQWRRRTYDILTKRQYNAWTITSSYDAQFDNVSREAVL